MPSVVVASSVRPWITTLAMRPAFTSSRNWEYSSVFCATWRVLNWLKTVISTTPITSQMARFLKRLFKGFLYGPAGASKPYITAAF